MTDKGAGGSGVILCHACQKPVRFTSTNIEHLDGSSLCIEPEPLKSNHHLPECWAKHESDPPAWCICDELRACEARVAEETEAAMMEFFYWKPSPPHDKHYFADNICAYCVGYREAFTAARKAVAALPEYRMRDTCVAAIDALKEKQ